jgi:hypothetical protein
VLAFVETAIMRFPIQVFSSNDCDREWNPGALPSPGGEKIEKRHAELAGETPALPG